MSGIQQLMVYPWRPVLVDGADFDGTNDYMARGAGLTDAADSKTGILSVWFRLDGGDGSFLNIFDGVSTITTRCTLFRQDTNTLRFFVRDTSNVEALLMDTVATYTASTVWRHYLASWDVNAGVEHQFVNDVSDESVTTRNNVTIDYTLTNWFVGADVGANRKFDGALAELYFAPGQYLDFSAEANRRKFITATGVPADLGADGSTPTGSAPIVYQRIAKGAAVTTFATNNGGGGNFTITGTFDRASTSPSD